MICICCNTKMICVSDVNDAGTRIDFEECPDCKSTNEIHYDNKGISDYIWKRGKVNE